MTGVVQQGYWCGTNAVEPPAPSARRQRRWAHLAKNLRGRTEANGPWQAEATALLALAEEVLAVRACYREGVLDRATMRGMLRALQQAMREHIEAGQQQMHRLGRALRPAVLWRTGCIERLLAAAPSHNLVLEPPA